MACNGVWGETYAESAFGHLEIKLSPRAPLI